MKVIVAYHDPAVLAACPAADDAERLLLTNCRIPHRFSGNEFAESRAMLHFALNTHLIPSQGFMGLFQASYPRKFSHLVPLEHFEVYEAPTRWNEVLAACVCDDLTSQTHYAHPGMDVALEQVIGGCLRPRRTVMCNTFVAHVDVWRHLLAWWLRAFIRATELVFPTMPWITGLYKANMEQAYFCERLTASYFAARTDLTVVPLRGMIHPISTYGACPTVFSVPNAHNFRDEL